MKKIRSYSINILKDFKIYQKFLSHISREISYKLQNIYIYVYMCVYMIKLKLLYQCIKEHVKTLKIKFEHLFMFHFQLHDFVFFLV